MLRSLFREGLNKPNKASLVGIPSQLWPEISVLIGLANLDLMCAIVDLTAGG